MTEAEFLEILEEISAELPPAFFQELNGGIIMHPEEKRHPESTAPPLWIMGEYSHGSSMGRYINIYYGSFCNVYGNLGRQAMKKKIRHTVLHEFRHHLESLAGEKDLEIEDAVNLYRYKYGDRK